MKREFIINGERTEIDLVSLNDGLLQFKMNGTNYQFYLKGKSSAGKVVVENGGRLHPVSVVSPRGGSHYIDIDGVGFHLEKVTRGLKRGGEEDHGHMVSPMPGKVMKVLVEQGQEVSKGETLLILEAMKMEHAIKAPNAGRVKEIFFQEGALVEGGQELIEIDEDEV